MLAACPTTRARRSSASSSNSLRTRSSASTRVGRSSSSNSRTQAVFGYTRGRADRAVGGEAGAGAGSVTSHVETPRSLLRGAPHAADGRRPRPLRPAQGRQRVSLRDLALRGRHRPGDDGPRRDPRHHRPPARPRRAAPGGAQAAGGDRRRDRRRRRDRSGPGAGGDRRARAGAGRGAGADHHAAGGRRAGGGRHRRGRRRPRPEGLGAQDSPSRRRSERILLGRFTGPDLGGEGERARADRAARSSAASRSGWSSPSTTSAIRATSTTSTSGCSRRSPPARRRASRPPGRWPRSDCRTRSTRPSRSAAAGPASCTTRRCRRWRCCACGSPRRFGRRPPTSCTRPARRPSSRSTTRS